MRWLHDVQGPTDEFNQTLVFTAPAGVTEADVEAVLQALLDRHATLRLQVADDGADGWSLTVPEPGSVPAGQCVSTVAALSDEVLVAARSDLDPAAGRLVRAVWAADTGQLALIIHHLAVDGCRGESWSRTSTSPGHSITTAADRVADRRDLVRPVVEGARGARPQHRGARVGRGVAAGGAHPAVVSAVQPDRDTYASAGTASVSLDTATTRRLLGEVPAAFHAGCRTSC